MHEAGLSDVVAGICKKDSRYAPDAYLFVCEALDFTVKLLKKPNRGPDRHVKGRELLEGIRSFALQEFGPLALTVLEFWGVHSTEDFGEIVFNLVATGKLGKTQEDTKEDFAGGYDFFEAFRRPFLPADTRPHARRVSRAPGDQQAS